MQTLILVLHIIAAVGIVVLVLLQHGKGADMGAAFGSGSAGSLFGSSGSANFLSRSTAALTALFFVTSLGLTYLSTSKPSTQGVIVGKPIGAQDAPAGDKPAVPEAPVPDADSKTKDIPNRDTHSFRRAKVMPPDAPQSFKADVVELVDTLS